MRRTLLAVAAAFAIAVFAPPLRSTTLAQETPLNEMVRTEQRFAERALVVGWKQAFLEYFADSAVGFDGTQAVAAKSLFRKEADPPKSLRILWEPRYGDIAASGELGYLTGPVRSIDRTRNNGQPRHLVYASVWKRQPDGGFKVVLDFGGSTPGPVTFPPGFTRAPRVDAYAGNATIAEATRSLRDTDASLTYAARSGQADAYRGHLADGVRLHRPAAMPLVGQEAVIAWLAAQPAYAAGESKFAEAARSGDLGYTYGSYAMKGQPADHGFYVRVWIRGRDGVWRVALDVLQLSKVLEHEEPAPPV
jgi:ketosteroid isomerase-like protein